MSKGILLLVLAGVGKSHLDQRYDNVIDVESSYYNYLLTKEQLAMDIEHIKGTKRVTNPEFPKNYVKAIKEALNKYDIVTAALSVKVANALGEEKMDYMVIYPHLDMEEEIVERCIKRGNTEEFIVKIRRWYKTNIEYFSKTDKPKIVVQKGEYLEDVLIRHGLLEKVAVKG